MSTEVGISVRILHWHCEYVNAVVRGGRIITFTGALLGGVDDPLGSLAEPALGLALGLPDRRGGNQVHERGILRLHGGGGGGGRVVGDAQGAPHLRDGRLRGGRGRR